MILYEKKKKNVNEYLPIQIISNKREKNNTENQVPNAFVNGILYH